MMVTPSTITSRRPSCLRTMTRNFRQSRGMRGGTAASGSTEAARVLHALVTPPWAANWLLTLLP